MAGLSDGWYRKIETDLLISMSGNLWGTEKSNQYYMIYLLAADEDTTFVGKFMPMMRVKSVASQVISLGTNGVPSVGIGYGFVADELVGGKIYILSGDSIGLLREISANNDNDGGAGTITYSGSELTLSQGDWFAVLPPNINFRYIGRVENNGTSDFENGTQGYPIVPE